MDMELEHGCVLDVDAVSTVGFTGRGIENPKELLDDLGR
jgi:hypothetical protein